MVCIFSRLISGLMSIPLTFMTMKTLNSSVSRRLAEHKIAIPLSIPVYIFYNCFLGSIRLPSKLFTSIFTDPSESGKYVRRTVKRLTPQTWRVISSQMFDLGYRFPEMNEVVSGEFPTALIEAYEASS